MIIIAYTCLALIDFKSELKLINIILKQNLDPNTSISSDWIVTDMDESVLQHSPSFPENLKQVSEKDVSISNWNL